jgi:hypothetical protein
MNILIADASDIVGGAEAVEALRQECETIQ